MAEALSGKHFVFSPFHSHVSLSNSACYERNRANGGKRGFISEKFTEWILTPFEDSKQYFIPLYGPSFA